jgi:uncharacterized protein (TIGR03435 family)
MKKRALILLLSAVAIHAATPAFEVAAITPCAAETSLNTGDHGSPIQFEANGRFNAHAISVTSLIEWAYNLQPFQHSDGPGWMKTDCYDVVAKADGNVSAQQMRSMARTLLGERFRLQAHQETKVLPTLVFSLGKTAPKISPANADEAHALTMTPQRSADQKITSYNVIFKHYTLAELGDIVSRRLERVVLNSTGMEGAYDFNLSVVPDESLPNPVDPTVILRAIREDLGFTLDSRNTPLDYLVVDKLERPSAN